MGSIKYAKVSTRSDITFVVGVLGKKQSFLGNDYWMVSHKVMRYLQGNKEYMMAYRRMGNLEIEKYTYLDLGGYLDVWKSTFGYIFMLARNTISQMSKK